MSYPPVHAAFSSRWAFQLLHLSSGACLRPSSRALPPRRLLAKPRRWSCWLCWRKWVGLAHCWSFCAESTGGCGKLRARELCGPTVDCSGENSGGCIGWSVYFLWNFLVPLPNSDCCVCRMFMISFFLPSSRLRIVFHSSKRCRPSIAPSFRRSLAAERISFLC